MAADSDTHPSADVLRNFGLGKLADDVAAAVLRHLENCDACREQVAALSGDSFLQQLRLAQGRSSTPMPGKPVADLPRQIIGPGNRSSISDLPPELADNPLYEILRELGRGGMGVVYLARNRQMDRLEVLKVVGRESLSRPGARQRFEREIKSAARLNHPNVVAAHCVVPLESLLALAMEYVEGEDLAKLVKARGPLPIPYACHYARQAALGLQHAHEKQMVHRDIKPQNLILTRYGKKHTVKILDFGLAKANCEKGQQYELTAEGKMLGTPLYVAPEQISDAATADIRADIYSLGCTLYCMLTGNPPFTGSGVLAILRAHREREATPLHEVRPQVPEELAAVVRKMMAKDPAKRYQTPGDVAQALMPFIKPDKPPDKQEARSGKGSDSADGWEKLAEPTASQRPADPAQWRRWMIGAGVLTTVVLTSLAGLWAFDLFKAKTKQGTLAVVVNEPNAEVEVDGKKITTNWSNNGKKAEIQLEPGTHKITISKEGFTVAGETVTLADGKREVFTAKINRLTSPPAVSAKESVVSKETPRVAATRTRAKKEDDFVPLFNGRNLDGWKRHPADKAEWRVERGLLVGRGPKGHLFSERDDYANFIYRVEAMINDRGNSGQFFRTKFGPSFPKGYEAQINCTHTDLVRTGSLYNFVKILQAPHKPDEWFTQEVTAIDNHIVIKVNGKTTVDFVDNANTYTKGHFALQQHDPGTVVKFRKVEVKELP